MINCSSLRKFYKHQLNNFQITLSLLALVGESFQTNIFPVSGEFKSHRHSLSQCLRKKTHSVLGEFYEPEFCEISLATLYTGLLVCHCS